MIPPSEMVISHGILIEYVKPGRDRLRKAQEIYPARRLVARGTGSLVLFVKFVSPALLPPVLTDHVERLRETYPESFWRQQIQIHYPCKIGSGVFI